MTREADDAHVMAEVLAAELRANAEPLGHLPDLGFHLQIAVGVTISIAVYRQ